MTTVKKFCETLNLAGIRIGCLFDCKFNPFHANAPYTPLKHQKTSVFLMFSGGTEMEHWLKMY